MKDQGVKYFSSRLDTISNITEIPLGCIII